MNDLCKARLEKALDDLKTAKDNANLENYRLVMNRSYYVIFHAIRAVNSLDGFDSKKHSGVIAHFRQNYIKTGRISDKNSDIIEELQMIRNASDYDDFYIVSKDDAIEQMNNAEIFLNEIKDFLKKDEQSNRPM